MMSQYHRNLIENLKRATSVTITFDHDGGQTSCIQLDRRRAPIKKVAHDIAIAVQDFLVKAEDDGTRKFV